MDDDDGAWRLALWQEHLRATGGLLVLAAVIGLTMSAHAAGTAGLAAAAACAGGVTVLALWVVLPALAASTLVVGFQLEHPTEVLAADVLVWLAAAAVSPFGMLIHVVLLAAAR